MKKDIEGKTIEKEVDLARRKFLLGGAGVIIGGAIVGGIGSSILNPREAHAAPLGYLPGPPDYGTGSPKTIDPTVVRALAFRHYNLNGG